MYETFAGSRQNCPLVLAPRVGRFKSV